MTAKRLATGLTVVTVGLILLANTMGYLPWESWWNILVLWPLLIVAAGIDILGRALKSAPLRVVSSLVVIGGLVYGALAGAGRVPAPAVPLGPLGSRAFEMSEPHTREIESATLRVTAGLGKVTVKPGEALATVKGNTPTGKPEFKVTKRDGTAEVRVSTAQGGQEFVAVGRRAALDIAIDPTIVWKSMKLQASLSQAELDLSRLAVQTLEADLSMSNATITFGDPSKAEVRNAPHEVRVNLSGGMSTLKIRVPRSVGVEISSEGGLGSVNVRGGWTRRGGSSPFEGSWRSDGYDSAASTLHIKLQAGLTNADVERY